MAEQVFKKEADGGWNNDNRNDFVGESEITVTVTLHEYRELVEFKAKTNETIRLKDEEIRKARVAMDEAQKKLDALIETLGVSGDEE